MENKNKKEVIGMIGILMVLIKYLWDIGTRKD